MLPKDKRIVFALAGVIAATFAAIVVVFKSPLGDHDASLDGSPVSKIAESELRLLSLESDATLTETETGPKAPLMDGSPDGLPLLGPQGALASRGDVQTRAQVARIASVLGIKYSELQQMLESKNPMEVKRLLDLYEHMNKPVKRVSKQVRELSERVRDEMLKYGMYEDIPTASLERGRSGLKLSALPGPEAEGQLVFRLITAGNCRVVRVNPGFFPELDALQALLEYYRREQKGALADRLLSLR